MGVEKSFNFENRKEDSSTLAPMGSFWSTESPAPAAESVASSTGNPAGDPAQPPTTSIGRVKTENTMKRKNPINHVTSKAYDDEFGWMVSRNLTYPGNIRPVVIPRVQILQGNNTKVNNKRKHDNTLVLTEKKKEPIKKKIKEIIEVDLVSSSDDEVVCKPAEAETTQASSGSIDADCSAIASQEKKLKLGFLEFPL